LERIARYRHPAHSARPLPARMYCPTRCIRTQRKIVRSNWEVFTVRAVPGVGKSFRISGEIGKECAYLLAEAALLAELGVLAAWNDNPSVWIDTVSVPAKRRSHLRWSRSVVVFLALGGLLAGNWVHYEASLVVNCTAAVVCWRGIRQYRLRPRYVQHCHGLRLRLRNSGCYRPWWIRNRHRLQSQLRRRHLLRRRGSWYWCSAESTASSHTSPTVA